MRYLFSIYPEETNSETKDEWAPTGEPIIPWYPATIRNVFLSTVSFKPSMYAEVKDVEGLDVDAIAARLKLEYPGLPDELHNNYVFSTAKLAMNYPVGSRFRIFITQDKASVQDIKTDTIYVLWNKQPME